MGGATGLDTRGRELARAGEDRQGGRVKDESRAGGAGHLEAVAEQAEAGDVGRGADPGRDERLRGWRG